MGRHEGKTEKATPRRAREARRKGQFARTAEVGAALSLVTALVTLRIAAPEGANLLRRHTVTLFSSVRGDRLPVDLLRTVTFESMLVLVGPFLLVGLVLGVAGGAAQTGLRLAPEAARPKLSHLHPRRGLERLKPVTAGWELVRSLVKLGLLGVLLAPTIVLGREALEAGHGLAGGLAALLGRVWTMLWRAVALAVLVAVADYLYNRWRDARQKRMSKDEVKREHRDSEGDPQIRAQRRQRAAALSRNRMIRDVALADVVVTNPTHLAVALAYRPEDAAPRIVAKGADHLAARIRREARRHGVPVTEDKPLARALYRRCKVGQHVPVALYEAAAVVLAVAYRRRGRRIA